MIQRNGLVPSVSAVRKTLSVVTFLSVLSACGGGGGGGGSSTPTSVPTVSISASANSIAVGSPVTISWASTNATSCVATGAWSGAQTTSGSSNQTPSAAGSLSFDLQCTGAGGTGKGSIAVTATPKVPIIAVSAATVNPLARVSVTVTNDDPAANYTVRFSLGANVTYNVPLGISAKGILTFAAPPGALASLSPAAFVAGNVAMTIGWPDATGALQYSTPIMLQLAPLPNIPSSMAPGTVYLAYLTATKRLMVQASGNAAVLYHKVPTLNPGVAVKGSNQSARSIDAMITLVRRLQSNPNVQIPWGTTAGTTLNLSGLSLPLMDQLAAAQFQVVSVAASAKAQLLVAKTHISGQSAQIVTGSKVALAATVNPCALDAPACLSEQMSAAARGVTSAVADAASSLALAGAAIALAAGAPEIAFAAGVIGVVSAVATTNVGTAISAAIAGGTSAILNGTASADSLAPSLDYFASGLVKNAVTALGEMHIVDGLPVDLQVAYDSGMAAYTASQAYEALSQALGDAVTSGQLPSTPVVAQTYSTSLTDLPTSTFDNYNVILNPPPAGVTAAYLSQSYEDGSFVTGPAVTITNGTGTIPGNSYRPNPPPGGFVVTTFFDPSGQSMASTDYDTSYPSTSDTTSFPQVGNVGNALGGGGGGGGGNTQTFIKYTIDGVPYGPFDPCTPTGTCLAGNGGSPTAADFHIAVGGTAIPPTQYLDITMNSLVLLTLSSNGANLPIAAAQGPKQTYALDTATEALSSLPYSSVRLGTVGFSTATVVSPVPAGYPTNTVLFSNSYLARNVGATPGTVIVQLSAMPISPAPTITPGQFTNVADIYASGSFDFFVADPVAIPSSLSIGSHEVKGTFLVKAGTCTTFDGTTMSCNLGNNTF